VQVVVAVLTIQQDHSVLAAPVMEVVWTIFLVGSFVVLANFVEAKDRCFRVVDPVGPFVAAAVVSYWFETTLWRRKSFYWLGFPADIHSN
jgi:hypothetical protein